MPCMWKEIIGGIAMNGKDLCGKCTEKFNKYFIDFDMDDWPWVHCHHKPKSSQKCKYEEIIKGVSIGTIIALIISFIVIILKK